MISSNRRFGIEIEFACKTADELARIQQTINVVHDGSLRPLKYAGEYVSQPLQGKGGEETIRHACEILKKYGAEASDPKTSIHVHLDGRVGEGNLRKERSADSKVPRNKQIAISNKVKQELSTPDILNLVNGRQYNIKNPPQWYTSEFDGMRYYSLAPLKAKPRINYTYYWLEKPNRFHWLRNMFFFYTKFSDVMEAIVSDSRKYGNMYCIPLGKSYDLDVIADTETTEDLSRVWYKDRQPRGQYDDSRYHNVNFDCFWYKHGTVEIRSHGGTLDPNKVLLWTVLHQKIADKLEDMPFEDLYDLGNTPRDFVNFIEDPMLQDYVKRLLGFYSGIKLS